MRPLELLVIYLLMGLCTGVAQHRSGRAGAVYAVPLWPLFLPSLLASRPAEAGEERAIPEGWRGRIEASAELLRRALLSWEALPDAAGCLGATEAVVGRLGELAHRLADLDQVLASPDHAPAALEGTGGADAGTRALILARQQNVEKLRNLREQTATNLEHALAAMADLATRVHLARFQGDAAEEIATELTRLAAAVDGGGEVEQIGHARVRIEA